jgi:nitrite reductase/ring-hydroxylating ferredoxin subunit
MPIRSNRALSNAAELYACGSAIVFSPKNRERTDVEDVFVEKVDAFKDRQCRLVSRNGHEVGVFRLGDEYFAWHNRCAHQGGPVCQGRVFPRVIQTLGEDQIAQEMKYSEEDIHIVCPWHGYEYDIRTGRNAGHSRLRLRPAPVVVRDGAVYVQL